MKDLRCSSTSSAKSSRNNVEKTIPNNQCDVATSAKSSRNNVEKTLSSNRVDVATIENNPKIDTQLLLDYHRLVDASKGVTKRKRGANYRLSHPFGSNDVPSDAIPIGRRRDIIKRPKHR